VDHYVLSMFELQNSEESLKICLVLFRELLWDCGRLSLLSFSLAADLATAALAQLGLHPWLSLSDLLGLLLVGLLDLLCFSLGC